MFLVDSLSWTSQSRGKNNRSLILLPTVVFSPLNKQEKREDSDPSWSVLVSLSPRISRPYFSSMRAGFSG